VFTLFYLTLLYFTLLSETSITSLTSLTLTSITLTSHLSRQAQVEFRSIMAQEKRRMHETGPLSHGDVKHS
jgi:hypothetical protein